MDRTPRPDQGAPQAVEPADSGAKSSRRRKTARRGFGTIRQLPSGRWQARWDDQFSRTHTGPHPFETKREAEDWLSTVRADLVRGVWRSPDVGSETLAAYMERWVSHRTDLALSTRAGYERALHRWIARDLLLPSPRAGKSVRINIGEQPLNALTVAMIREWYAAASVTQVREREERHERGKHRRLTERVTTAHIRVWGRTQGWTVPETGKLRGDLVAAWEAAGRPGEPVLAPVGELRLNGAPAAAVVVQAYRYLRACLNAAVDDGLIHANPCRVKNGGLLRSAERPHASPEEVRALCAAMPERFAEAVDLAAWSALRAGELFGLARRHVDLNAGTVTVERALIDVAGYPLGFGPPKTASSLRTVALPDSVVQRLGTHMAMFTGPDPDALVFAHADGSALRRDQRTAMFDRARRAIGRPDLRWHDLRHTGATLAARAGGSLRELQARLGHSTVNAAMRYQHASAARDRELADRLEAYASIQDIDSTPRLHLVRPQ